MLRIRFFRVGKKNQPFFKIVVTDKRRPPRGGRFVERVGFYNPLKKEKVFKKERIKYWLSVGARPSDTVYNLLISEKIIEGKKIAKHKKAKKKKPASAEAKAGKEKPPAPEAPVSEAPKKQIPKTEGKKPASTPATAGKEEKPEKPEKKEKGEGA